MLMFPFNFGGGDIITRIEKSIEINASPEKIWKMTGWEKLPEWHTDWKTVEWTSKDKNKVGSTLHLTGETAGVKADMDLEVTEIMENKKVAWRTIRGNITGFGSITLTPTESGTKFSEVIDYELPYSVLGKLLDKLRVHKAIDNSYEAALKRLKNMAETKQVLNAMM